MANSLPFMATSGLYGIIIALHRCAEVDLYGFQVSNQHGAKCESSFPAAVRIIPTERYHCKLPNVF
jgi:hypothetical protein